MWRLESETDSGRGAGGNDIAGQECHELADVAHEEGDFENEICSGAVLFGFSVDLEPEAQGVWVGNFVCCGQPRTQRGEGVGAFAFDPLTAALELPGAFAVVVVEDIAGDMSHGIGLGDGAGGFSDHHGQLNFPVGFFRSGGNDESIVRAGEGGGGFEENDGFGGDGHAAFLRMVAVIEADADDLAGPCNRASKAGSRCNDRRGGGVVFDPRGEAVQSAGFKEGLVEIGGAGGNIDGGSVGEKDARFFRALGAEFDEFHGVLAKKSEAAVDVVCGTGDKCSFVRAEKCDERGDFLWFTHAADGLTS